MSRPWFPDPSDDRDLPDGGSLRDSAAPLPGRRGRATGPAEPPTNEPLGPDDRPDVGLAQTGGGEDAITRRETEI